MNFEIKDLPGMITVQCEGKTRQESKEKLDEYLKNVNLSAKTYFYLEFFSGGKVAGAITLAKVDEEPEHNKKFRSRVLDSERYVVVEMPYDVYQNANTNGSETTKRTRFLS